MLKAIQFRSHAKEQLKERNIPEDLVRDVVRHPGQVVVYEEKRSALEIVTVYLTKKVKKYWEDKHEDQL